MSLRVDDRSGRSRSKSPAGKRDRSRSNVRAPSPGPAYTTHEPAIGGGYGGAQAGATPQYDVRQPSQPAYAPHGNSQYASSASPFPTTPHNMANARASSSDPSSEFTMGDYSDLPPHERPGYVQQAQGQYQYVQSQARGPASPASPGVQYAQPLQYAQSQYGYTQAPTNQPAPIRTVSGAGAGGGFQYAQPPDKITFTAKPVVQSSQPPPIRHNTQPKQPQSPQGQYQQQQQQQQQQQYSNYTVAPQNVPPPPPQPPAQYHQPQQPQPQQQQQQPQQREPQQREPLQREPLQREPLQREPLQREPLQPQHSRQPSGYSTYDNHKVVEIVPGGGRINAPPSPGLHPHRMSTGGPHPDLRAPSPSLMPRMDRLSVSGNRPDIQTIVPGQAPPASPLLEAYHGVYQSISPMPYPIMLPDDDIDDLPLLSPRASSSSIHGRHHSASSSSRRNPSPPSKPRRHDKLALEKEKRVKIYDATDDALALVEALAQRTPDVDALIDILPALSHDQMLDLRAEYKRHCKVQGRGINIAKHIKLKTSGNFGKICYVTALGKYESEGYWANFWYQSSSARRELLIEALMGRPNHEMREIKDAFKDKRYGDSLTRCMDKELKADKFRKAVLMALEAERQEESDAWPTEYRNKDVDTLYRALKAREGGESAILGVVVMRSDAHLREVLRTYERKYQGNFARDALKKSNNLVGEVIAHILNGVINRPARDCMLLHHALIDLIEPPEVSSGGPRSSSSKLAKDTSAKHERQQRYELLISRLVRMHWDRMHLMRVKSEYEEKYGRVVEEDVEEATKGDFREFCLALCQTGR